ncbi:hypothetical protein [Lysobacter sp. CA199]|uniref:hypothetical protein n=1 Tax=Lysobacter sp. CA199 TaxID=3455608 RepID=UPI003F8D65D4
MSAEPDEPRDAAEASTSAGTDDRAGRANAASASAATQGKAYALARAVSIVLHPFAIFLLLTLLGVDKLAPRAMTHALLGIGVAIAVTWLFVLQRRYSGRWGTVDASHRSERPLLYWVLLAVLAVCWWWMRGLGGSLSAGIVSVAAMLIVAAVLNAWIKLSLHMASLAFAAVSLIGLSLPWACAAAALLPVLGWARLRMARHSAAEVIGGTVLGLLAGAVLRAVVG